MSSCGLIYKHFGKQFLKKVAHDEDGCYTDTIFYKMYKCGILEIDANDNGVFIKIMDILISTQLLAK